MFWDKDANRRKEKYSWLPTWATITRETVAHYHVPEERAELFDAYNAGSTELELLNWLHATVRVLKPSTVLETGAADGLGTIALASACQKNKFGTVHSVEIDPKLCEELDRKLRKEGLREFVQIHCQDSREFLLDNSVIFDLGFFDSLCEIRAEEFAICLEKRTIGRMAVFHDTSPLRCLSAKDCPPEHLHSKYRDDVKAFAVDPRCSGFFESGLSRGFICLFINSDSQFPCAKEEEGLPGNTRLLGTGGKETK